MIRLGNVIITPRWVEPTVIIKRVPAEVCQNREGCNLSGGATEQGLARMEEAVKKDAEAELLRFPA